MLHQPHINAGWKGQGAILFTDNVCRHLSNFKTQIIVINKYSQGIHA